MILDGGDHHLARQLEKARLETSHDRHRPFDQRRHFIEQLAPDQGRAPRVRSGLLYAGSNARAPRREIRHDFGAEEAPLIGLRGPELDRARGVKAMTARGAAGGQSQNLDRQYLLAEEQHDAVHRTHELCGARTPAHAPRDRQRRNRLVHDIADEARRGGAALDPAEHEPGALVGDQPLKRRDLHAAIARKGGGRLRGHTGRIERARDRGTAPLDLTILRRLGARGHEHREPARRREPAYRAVRDAGRAQTLRDAFRERARQTLERARRKLLREQLEQQVA